MQRSGQGRGDVGVLEDGTDVAFAGGGTGGDGEAELSQAAAQRVDARGTGLFPLLAQAMELLKQLLPDAAHGHGPDAGTAICLEQRLGVGAVGLVAPPIRAHILRGDDARLMAAGLGGSGPVVGAGTGLEQHRRRCALGEQAPKASLRQSLTLNDT